MLGLTDLQINMMLFRIDPKESYQERKKLRLEANELYEFKSH